MERKRLSAEQVLQKVAQHNNTTLEEVRKEIDQAILIGLRDPDPAVQAKWKEIPRVGEVPTPEELIDYLVEILQSSKEKQSTGIVD